MGRALRKSWLRPSVPFYSKMIADDRLRQQNRHEHLRSRNDTKRESIADRSDIDPIFIRKSNGLGGVPFLGLRKRMVSVTIAAFTIFSISGTCAAMSSTPYMDEKDITIVYNQDLRKLQGNIQQCKIALAVGDIDRDDSLSQSEYLRFVNQLSTKILDDQNSDFVAFSSYDELPQGLKDNYDYFMDPETGKIDISGSKPGQATTPEQDMQLVELCNLTSEEIRDFDDQNTEAPSGNNMSNDEKDCSTTLDRGKCNVDLSISDSYQNDLLDESDYVKFVNRLSSNEYANYQFEQLPTNIKNNFHRFAIKDGQVDITGSKPGQRVSVEQDRFLNAFCCETHLAVQHPEISNTEAPVSQPNGSITPAPTFDLFFCQRSMASSDLDRDDGLTEEEYVIFLNRLTNNNYVGQTYDDLDSILQENFLNLIGNDGKINIYGSKPGQATNADEENALISICVETGNALNGESLPTDTKTPAPTISNPVEIPTAEPSNKITIAPTPQVITSPPTLSPNLTGGRSEAYNSFIISNSGGLTASDLREGTSSREGLDKAYGAFVQESVNNYTTTDQIVEVISLRRRKLAVEFLPESDKIYLIVDSDCPLGSSAQETCQTAFAKFELTLDGENAQDVSDFYTKYTQTGISEGRLNVILKEVDPRTILKIVNSSYPVTPQNEEITKAPTTAPTDDEEKQKRKLAGPIVGGVFVAIVLFAAVGYIAIKGLPFDLPFDLPSFPHRGGARVGNKNDGINDEARLRLGFGQDEEDASVGDKNAFGKDFGLDSRIALGDGDTDDIKEEQTDKNRFSFANKKKKNDEEDIDFGLESKRDINASAADVSDNMYAFEEPSEMNSATEDQDERISTTENEDIVFGAQPESSNWGTSNVFGASSSNQEWGANGGDDNFFGTSAFGERQEEKESSSRSGSEGSESYSSEDETYESGDIEEVEERSGQDSATYDAEEAEQEDSYSGSSADDSYNSSSLPSEKMPSDLRMKNEDMDAAIDNGDWDAVVEAAKAFDKGDQESSMTGSSKKMAYDGIDEDIDDEESYSDSYSESGDGSATTETTTSEDHRKRAKYRAQVEELVQIVLPDETEKVDAMMDQFKGREAELVSTLQTMEERSSNQRARAAVHKSKPPSQQQNGAFSMGGANGAGVQGGEGSTAGTAAIAAASLPIPAEGMFDDEAQNNDFDAFGDEGGDQNDEVEGSEYSNNYDDDRSYYSEGESQASGSLYSEEEGSEARSYYSEEGSQQKSFYSQEEGSQEGSFYSQEEGSQQQSFYSQDEGETISETYYSEEGSRSYYSGEESYVSGEEGSFVSGEESANDQE